MDEIYNEELPENVVVPLSNSGPLSILKPSALSLYEVISSAHSLYEVTSGAHSLYEVTSRALSLSEMKPSVHSL